jgi:hypothetical protein
VILSNGKMHVKTESELRCMVCGDLAIEGYDPYGPIDHERDEPLSVDVGPRQGDVLLLRIDGCRAACEVLEVGSRKGRPLYIVKYDDGMLVQDHLVVPWGYLSTAPPAPRTFPTDAAANGAASHSSAVAPPMSANARGKRRAIDVMAEAAESMQAPSPVETATAPSPPPTTPPPPDNPVEDHARKSWEIRELRNEQEYGELLDSIIL